MILLVRNQNVLPAVARLEPAAGAAAYVAALEGQILDQADVQTLGANPLFPLSAVAQGTRLLELLAAHSPGDLRSQHGPGRRAAGARWITGHRAAPLRRDRGGAACGGG